MKENKSKQGVVVVKTNKQTNKQINKFIIVV
jgi:hypothetical protein